MRLNINAPVVVANFSGGFLHWQWGIEPINAVILNLKSEGEQVCDGSSQTWGFHALPT
jgi:hypothetical protein